MSLATRSLIVFDLDGTLVDSLGATIRGFQRAVAPVLGRTPTREEVFDRFGPSDHRIVRDWVGEAEAEAAIARLYAAYREDREALAPFPGVPELLRDLKAGERRLALFTGRGRPSTEYLLAAHGLSEAFDLVVTSDDVPAPKPAPDGLHRVLDQLGATADHGAYIGDTIKDIEAARAAGLLAVAALWGSPEPERVRGAADLVLETVAAAAAILGEAVGDG